VAKAKTQPKTQAKTAKKSDQPQGPGTRTETPPRLLTTYRDTIVPQLTKEFDYSNVMQVPRVAKIVVNIGIGEAKDNDKALDAAVGDVVTIACQKPALFKAKKSVAAFTLGSLSLGIYLLEGGRLPMVNPNFAFTSPIAIELFLVPLALGIAWLEFGRFQALRRA